MGDYGFVGPVLASFRVPASPPCAGNGAWRPILLRNEGGLLGGKRTWAWEVKFLDRPKTNYSEGIFQGYLPQSRTKVWGSKMIRDHCSPHHKRWPPWIGEFLWRHLQARPGWCPTIKYSTYVHVLSSQEVKLLALTGTSSARSLTVSRESFEVTVSGGSTFARVKLKEIDGMAPQDVERAV